MDLGISVHAANGAEVRRAGWSYYNPCTPPPPAGAARKKRSCAERHLCTICPVSPQPRAQRCKRSSTRHCTAYVPHVRHAPRPLHAQRERESQTRVVTMLKPRATCSPEHGLIRLLQQWGSVHYMLAAHCCAYAECERTCAAPYRSYNRKPPPTAHAGAGTMPMMRYVEKGLRHTEKITSAFTAAEAPSTGFRWSVSVCASVPRIEAAA